MDGGMDMSRKEEAFKNKAIGDKVRDSFGLIFRLYLGSIALACIMIFLMMTTEPRFEVGVSVVFSGILIVIAIIAVWLTVRREHMLIKYIVDPLAELSSVAGQITQGNLNIDIAYDADDELGALAADFHRTAVTLGHIIDDLSVILQEFAKGDYTVESGCKEQYVGAFGTVLQNLETTVLNISTTLQTIRQSSDAVASGAEQMAISSQNLARGASDQSTAIDDLVLSVSEVTRQVVSNSESTDIVHDKAKEVGVEAKTSQQKMQALVQAIERISITSQEIGNVIAEIENIAAQTNLLSLNASIEAARAGEAGRGFAVVAEQIRTLAESSAQSADESKHMLEANLTEVEHGTAIVKEAADALNMLMEDLDEIIREVAKIRLASDEQAASVKKIETGARQISDVIQSNSAASEESSATSEELSAEAVTLDELIRRFKLKS